MTDKTVLRKQCGRVMFAIILIIIAVEIIFCISKVSGDSMLPTYKNGDVITVNRFNNIKTRDVVIFYAGMPLLSDIYIKRVVGVPGDTVLIKDGYLYINGTQIQEDYPLMEDCGIAGTELTLSDNEYFVLGDNRNHSVDSREIGVIKRSNIIGTVN